MKQPIKNYPGYFIDEEGEVFSTKSNKVLSTHIDSWGYRFVTLHSCGKGKCIKIHKLVAETFIGDRPEGLQINHRDGNKLNNNVNNLEYCTPSQNTKHAFSNGLAIAPKGETHYNCKLSDDNIREIRRYKGQASQSAVGGMFGVSREHIRDIWNNKKRKEVA